MKKKLNTVAIGSSIVLMFLLIVFSSCSDNSSNVNNNSKLDSNLFGTWVFGIGDEMLSWKFNSDGTCVQTVYTQNYNWKWEIEDEKIKLYVTYGTPAYFKYKIEGNKLYLWVEQMNDWGLPFTKS